MTDVFALFPIREEETTVAELRKGAPAGFLFFPDIPNTLAGGIHSIASPFAVAMERKLNRSRFWRDPANRTLSSGVSYIAKGVFATQLYVTSRSIGRPIVAIFYSFLKRKHEGFDVYFLI